MPEIQEQLIRASAVARLEEIIRELRNARTTDELEPGARAWFVELLHPLSSTAGGVSRLTTSTEVSRVEGSAVLEILSREFAANRPFAEKLFVDIVSLLSRLVEPNAVLAVETRESGLDVARRLRRYFLGQDTLSPSSFDQLIA
jgi:hypothetical protein